MLLWACPQIVLAGRPLMLQLMVIVPVLGAAIDDRLHRRPR